MISVWVNTIALNRDGDKRVVCEDGISTLARGHYKLEILVVL